MKSLIHSYNDIKHCLINVCAQLLTCLYIDRISRLTYQERLSGLHIKNRKVHMLISQKSPTESNFKIPIVNLTSQTLSQRERAQLELALEQSFINKNKNQQKCLGANLESINQKVSNEINNDQKENLYKFLHVYTFIFIKNVNTAKDSTNKNFRHLIKEQISSLS